MCAFFFLEEEEMKCVRDHVQFPCTLYLQRTKVDLVCAVSKQWSSCQCLGLVTSTQMLMHWIAYRGCTNIVGVSPLYCLYTQLSYITSLPSTLPFYVGSFHFSGWGRQLVPRGDAGFGVATAYPVHKDAADLNLNKVCFY